jgi:hypothetical protein
VTLNYVSAFWVRLAATTSDIASGTSAPGIARISALLAGIQQRHQSSSNPHQTTTPPPPQQIRQNDCCVEGRWFDVRQLTSLRLSSIPLPTTPDPRATKLDRESTHLTPRQKDQN